MLIIPTPLTAEAFAPYGHVLQCPRQPARQYHDPILANLRGSGASPSLSLITVAPTALPLRLTALERHAYSSQTFIPLDVAAYVVIVAPRAPDGGPDGGAAQAFLAGPEQAVSYHADTWHHGLTVLERQARFAILMWRAGDDGDEEFRPIAPVSVAGV
ncbi:ureidoglycolate hydrolase [Verticiella sediminum]|uniref:Ureidoglycolate hydrolase n=1 Tax=Verticiella sediminum TaxID=1247510 RepID=A0A556A7E5_9BURK|nr:ureidoglycolate lyase [Verticiella sediminum]TSH88799.1 ureidoglycolate hydrolase [Verticiella sediminum]